MSDVCCTKGSVFDIQRCSLHDGPGIRTVVFLKGCNLRCLWCHNPESFSMEKQIRHLEIKCIGCGRCIDACPTGAQQSVGETRLFRRELCCRCGRCADVCTAGALTLIGEKTGVAEVLSEIRKDLRYYERSGGGVTFSGGEPLLQSDFLFQLLDGCRRLGIHCAIESAVNVPEEILRRFIPIVDLWICDVKSLDSRKHKELTGSPNERILGNLRMLSECGCRLWLRTPFIPGLNDSEEEKSAVAAFAAGLAGVETHEFLPYHALGETKYETLGMEYPLQGLLKNIP